MSNARSPRAVCSTTIGINGLIRPPCCQGPGLHLRTQGSRHGVLPFPSAPGTLAFFRGRYSIHRVPPVEGSRPRLNSVLTYAAEPGHKLKPLTQKLFYGRTA